MEFSIASSLSGLQEGSKLSETSWALLSLFLGTEFKTENPGLDFIYLEKVEEMPVKVREIENGDMLTLLPRILVHMGVGRAGGTVNQWQALEILLACGGGGVESWKLGVNGRGEK